WPPARSRWTSRRCRFRSSTKPPTARNEPRRLRTPSLIMPLDSLTGAAARVVGPEAPRQAEVLTPDALVFLAELHRAFDGRRRRLLEARATRQARFDAGERPDFRADTADIRAGEWTVGSI